MSGCFCWVEGTNITVKAIKQGALTSYCKCIPTNIAEPPNYSKLKCKVPQSPVSCRVSATGFSSAPAFVLFLLMSQHVSVRLFCLSTGRKLMYK